MGSVYLIWLALSFGWAQSPDQDPPFNSTVSVEVHSDGTTTTETTSDFRIENDEARRQLAVQRIPFHRATYEAHVLEASISREGQSHKIPLSKIRRSHLKSNPENYGMTNMDEIEVPFENLQVGSITHLRYVVTEKPEALSFRGLALDAFFDLSGKVRQEIHIRSPHKIRYKVSDSSEISVREGKDGATYTLDVLHAGKTQNLSSLSVSELRTRLPRLQATTLESWQEFAKQVSPSFDVTKMPIPRLFETVGKSVRALPDESKKVEALLIWMAKNFTYSGRWLAPGAGWRPQTLQQLANEKVGDCKDIALSTLALMQAAGITAEPVLVGVNGFGPIDGKEPLPLLSYFNHIVVRYRMGQRWIVIDPGRAVADASRTPHFLNHMWALNLKEDKPTLYRIATEDKGYAELKLSSEVIERPTGGYFVRTRMDASGEAANEFKEHYFAEGPEGFRDMVEGLAPDDTLGFRITQQTEITRKSGPLHVEFEYGLADRKGKSKIYYPVHNLTRFGWNHQGARLHFARFSEDLEESVHFRGRFIADEIRYDNVVYGPMVSIERHVRNGGDGAWIEDKIHIPGWVDEGDEKATEQKRGQESIFAWQESHSHIRLGVLAGQRPFEASIDTAIPYSLKEDSERDREGWLSEYRRLQVYLKKVPKDPTLLKASALVVRELGRIGPRSFLNGHLRESNHLLEQAKALQPNSASLWAEIGKNLIWLDDESGARKAFFEGFRLSKADPDVLFLGGLINEKQQKYDAALPYYSAAIQSASSHAQKLEAYENQANVLCWRLTRCPQAAALYDHVLTMAPVKADSFHFAAAIYKQMGDAKKAMELEEKAKSLGGKEDVKFLAETEIQDYDQRYFVDSAYPEKLNQLSEEAANLYRKYPGNLKVLGYLIDLSVKMAKRDNDAIPLGIAHQYAEEARSRGLSADRFSEFEKKIEGAQHELAPARLPASRGTD